MGIENSTPMVQSGQARKRSRKVKINKKDKIVSAA